MPELQRPIVPLAFDFSQRDASGSAFWIEQIDDISPGSEEFSPKYAHATLYAFVPNSREAMYNFTNAVLGYHYTSSDFKHIKRTNPIRHPKYENLYATKISEVKGIRFGRTVAAEMTGRASGMFSMPAAENANEDGFFETITNQAANSVTTGNPEAQTDITNKGLTEYAIYNRNLVAVEFAPPKWKMRTDASIKGRQEETDAEIYQEWRRYIDYDTRTNIYDVTVATGQFTYQEGALGAPKGINFQGELNYYEVKTTFMVRWRFVPDDWVFISEGYELGYPLKVNQAAAKVNKFAFMGYPAGTLLLLEPEIDRYVSGTLKRNDPTGDNLPFYMCDVTLPIIHFDPSFGGLSRGHNLKPWRTATDTEMKYFLVKYTTSAGTPTNIKIYGEYDFNKIFEHWSV